MIKVLVTGGNGQLGRSIQKIKYRYPEVDAIYMDLPELDITDYAAMLSVLKRENIQCIINCAAYTAVDKAESEEAMARHVNEDGPQVLARCCKELDIQLIHISTDYVFSGTAQTPYREDDTPEPQSAYGRTKYMGEKAIEESGCRSVIIRTAWLYSEFGNNFLKTMLRIGAPHATVGVVADQKGTPTYASDLADVTLRFAVRDIQGFTYYHYTDEGETDWYHFAVAIFQAAHREVNVLPITSAEYVTPVKRPAYSVLDKQRIKAALSIEIPSWESSLQTAMAALEALNKAAKTA